MTEILPNNNDRRVNATDQQQTWVFGRSATHETAEVIDVPLVEILDDNAELVVVAVVVDFGPIVVEDATDPAT